MPQKKSVSPDLHRGIHQIFSGQGGGHRAEELTDILNSALRIAALGDSSIFEQKVLQVNHDGTTVNLIGAGIVFEGDGNIVGYVRVSDTDITNLELKAPEGFELTLNINTDSTLIISGDSAINQDVTNTAAVTFASLTLGATGVAVTTILDEDDLVSNSAVALVTQQSVKAYIDAQVASADTLSEILAIGNVTGSNNIIVTAGQKITTDTITETTVNSGVTIDGLTIKDGAVTVGSWNGSSIPVLNGGTGASTASGARTNLGLVIGTDIQGFGDILDDFNTLGASISDGQFIVATGIGSFVYESGDTVRTSLGLGTGDSPSFTGLTVNGIDITAIEAGAEVNVNADFNAVSGDALILNKPTTITAQQASDITANNAKVSNATHTGEVTGATVLTVDPTAISNKALKSVLAGTEEMLINDAGTLKKTTPQDIADLGVSGGGFGAEFEKFESLAQSNTSSSTLQSKVDATTTTKPAGTYRIQFTTEAANSSGGNTTAVEFSIDGVTTSNHANGSDFFEVSETDNNDWGAISLVVYKTLASPATIDLDIKFANSSGTTARVFNSVIEIWKVS